MLARPDLELDRVVGDPTGKGRALQGEAPRSGEAFRRRDGVEKRPGDGLAQRPGTRCGPGEGGRGGAGGGGQGAQEDEECECYDRSGEWQVWRMPADGGPAVQLTRGGGYRALESPDGRWLYYTRWQADGLWRMPREGGDEERVLGEELKSWNWGNWAVAAAGVYFVTGDPAGRESVALYDPVAGAVVRRLPLAGTPVRPSLALSPTGGPALLVQLDRVESDLLLVDGFGG